VSDFNDELISPSVHWTKWGARREYMKLLRWLNGERDALGRDRAPSPYGPSALCEWETGQCTSSRRFVQVVSLGRFHHRCVITPAWGAGDPAVGAPTWLEKRIRERLALAEAFQECADHLAETRGEPVA
jgi:hypothetical protein